SDRKDFLPAVRLSLTVTERLRIDLGWIILRPSTSHPAAEDSTGYGEHQESRFMDKIIARILKRLQREDAQPLELLQVYQDGDHRPCWEHDARLHRAVVRRLISDGHPTRAFELAREGLALHSEDQELKYLIGLALARGGNISKATTFL